MDVMTSVVPGAIPGAAPKAVYMTINGAAGELEGLMNAIQQALVGGPQVCEVQSATGATVRIVIDRIGPAIPKN